MPLTNEQRRALPNYGDFVTGSIMAGVQAIMLNNNAAPDATQVQNIVDKAFEIADVAGQRMHQIWNDGT